MNRSINLPQAIALYISAILGSGILFLSASTASIAGPASIVSWLVMVLFSFPLAYTFAILSRSYPDVGGAATFVRMAFGEHSGNLVGWFYFITAAVGQIIVSLTGANYIGATLHWSPLPIAGIACLILLIGGLSNHYGIQVSGKISLILSSLLVVMLSIAMIVTIPFVEWDNFKPFAPKGWVPIGTAVIMIFWSFFGWEAICSLANRFKNPQKNMVRSAMISAVVIGVVFLSLSFITIGSGTYGSLESDSSPIGVMVEQSLGFGAQLITAVFAFIICTGTVNAFVASLTQLGYALSRDHAFPSWLHYLNPHTETPTRVVWFVIIFATSGVMITTGLGIHFTKLLFIPNSLGIVVYILSMMAAMKLYKKKSMVWVSGLISLIVLVLFSPFLGLHLIVPVLVSSLYFTYKKSRSRKDLMQKPVNYS